MIMIASKQQDEGVCICGHRRPVAHPNGGECFDSVKTESGSKRCRCKKYVEAK